MSLYLIIMGVQGAGKGTQAALIQEKYGIPHVSTGDLFRAMKTRTDELAQRVQEIMAAGALVPDDVTNEVLQDRLEQPDARNGVILDGYPRNTDQAEWLEKYLAGREASISSVLLLELDYYTAFKRAYGRVKSGKNGQTYNVYFDEDKLDVQFVKHEDEAYPPRVEAKLKDNEEMLERRPDDEAASVVKRIDTYNDTTAPLVEYYRQKGLLREIDANQPIGQVSADIYAVIETVKQ